jgi:hypothetical protein
MFGWNYDNVIGQAEILVHDDASITITITCPPESLTLSEILSEEPVALSFVNVPSPREVI